MRVLLDTHVLLWIINGDTKLSDKAISIYLDQQNQVYLSVASIWEIAIKISLGKLSIDVSLESLVEEHVKGNDIQLLNIAPQHLYRLKDLPFHHRDPFDRLLVCQTQSEDMSILSKDIVFDHYDINRLW